jgi:ATP-dependent Clp protease ATP-binding subunit ClpC
MLLGLMQEREGLAAKVLGNLGIEIGMVRETIEAVLGRPERIIVQEVVPTSRVKKVIEIAFEESRRTGHNYVSTEHLLLGLLIEGEGIGAHVLEDLGATLSTVRTEIDRLLKDGSLVEGPPVRASRASATPVLDLCGRDLTHLASRNQLDFLSGRDSDVTRVVEILSQQNRNCALIVGDPTIRQGVLAGLAWRMYVDLVPTALANRHLKTLEPKAILRNAKARGDFRSRLEHSLHETIEEVMSVRGTLLAIDDIHVFFGGGDREWGWTDHVGIERSNNDRPNPVYRLHYGRGIRTLRWAISLSWRREKSGHFAWARTKRSADCSCLLSRVWRLERPPPTLTL